MLSIGLIGCGTVVHTNYATTLRGRSAYKVDYVYDLNKAQAASAATLYGAVAVSLEQLLDQADAIVISTPPSTHSDLILKSLKPSRVVLCEKPFTTRHADAVAVTTAAVGANTQLSVGHFRRTFPQLKLARQLIGMGLIGHVQSVSLSEGGRFTWKAVSNYTTKDPAGGVLWDTGSHTLDMVLFAAGIDTWDEVVIDNMAIQRDKPEPSHDFYATFALNEVNSSKRVDCKFHVSRKEALPNFIRIGGTSGQILFTIGMDNKVRLTTKNGSVVLYTNEAYVDLMECFDLQLRRIFLKDGQEDFAAARFTNLVKILEALSNG